MLCFTEAAKPVEIHADESSNSRAVWPVVSEADAKSNEADVKMHSLENHDSVQNLVKFGPFLFLKTLMQMLTLNLEHHGGH